MKNKLSLNTLCCYGTLLLGASILTGFIISEVSGEKESSNVIAQKDTSLPVPNSLPLEPVQEEPTKQEELTQEEEEKSNLDQAWIYYTEGNIEAATTELKKAKPGHDNYDEAQLALSIWPNQPYGSQEEPSPNPPEEPASTSTQEKDTNPPPIEPSNSIPSVVDRVQVPQINSTTQVSAEVGEQLDHYWQIQNYGGTPEPSSEERREALSKLDNPFDK
jgi:hypothetical protein